MKTYREQLNDIVGQYLPLGVKAEVINNILALCTDIAEDLKNKIEVRLRMMKDSEINALKAELALAKSVLGEERLNNPMNEIAAKLLSERDSLKAEIEYLKNKPL